MLNQKNSQAKFLANPANHLHKFLGFLRIHTCCRLIQKQQLWLGCQGTGNLQTALSTIRQIFGLFISMTIQLEDFQQFHAFFLNLLFLRKISAYPKNSFCQTIFYMGMKGNLNIIQHRQLRKKTNILESTGNASLSNLIRLLPYNALASKFNIASGRLINPGNQIESRGFASTIRTNQANKLTLINIEIKIRNSLQTAKYNGDIFRFEKYLAHDSCPLLKIRRKIPMLVTSI